MRKLKENRLAPPDVQKVARSVSGVKKISLTFQSDSEAALWLEALKYGNPNTLLHFSRKAAVTTPQRTKKKSPHEHSNTNKRG